MHSLVRALVCFMVCLPILSLATIVFADDARPIRLACVGDSITAGAGTKTPETQSYPAQLSQMLGEKWRVYNFGVSGATLLQHGDKPYQSLAAFTNALACNPQIVVIMLGTNDSKPQNWKYRDEFVGDYKSLILQFAKLSSHPRIFICRPPFVSGSNAFGIDEAGVLAEIPMIDGIAVTTGTMEIDNHAIFEGNPALLPDQVHPNEAGAAILARVVYEAVKNVK
jgi:acyl-CoA thioesterase I